MGTQDTGDGPLEITTGRAGSDVERAVLETVERWARAEESTVGVVGAPLLGDLRAVIATHGAAFYLVFADQHEEEPPLVRREVYGPYEELEAARDDAWRRLTAYALDQGLARRVARWGESVVALLRDWDNEYIVVEARRGFFRVERVYAVLEGYGCYVERVRAFAQLIEGDSAAEPNPVLRAVVSAWLQRDAADAWLEQARLSMGVALAGFAALQKLDASPPLPSVSELARGLGTDRPNLVRALKRAEAEHGGLFPSPGMRPRARG